MNVVKLADKRPIPPERYEMHGPGAWEAVRAYFDEWSGLATPAHLDGCADYFCSFLYNRGFDIVPCEPDPESCEADEDELSQTG